MNGVMAMSEEEIFLEFWNHVQMTDSCWMWIGALTPLGYGTFRGGKNKIFAHRFSYELMFGPIPEGLVIDHLCRVHGCVNPEHLEPVTICINNARGESPLAVNGRKMECPRGHQNYDVNIDGQRFCLTCRRELDRRRYPARKAAAAAVECEIIPCACGCGQLRPKRKRGGGFALYIVGHHGKRKSGDDGAQLSLAE
jgi:hypothetical protein